MKAKDLLLGSSINGLNSLGIGATDEDVKIIDLTEDTFDPGNDILVQLVITPDPDLMDESDEVEDFFSENGKALEDYLSPLFDSNGEYIQEITVRTIGYTILVIYTATK